MGSLTLPSTTEKYLKEEKEFIDLDSISGVQSWRNEVDVQIQSAKLLKAAEAIAQEVRKLLRL